MVDENDVTNFNRTKKELQEFLLFGMCVAGKTAKVQSKKLEEFLSLEEGQTPFEKIESMVEKGVLESNLKKVKMGKYTTLVPGFKSLAKEKPNLETISKKELETYSGIGPKTSRYFILHSREEANVACLDTHILKWMKSLGYEVPKSTPSGNRYKRIETHYLSECRKRGRHPAHLDLEIWKRYSKSS
jgi:thermostable 8-oxoguanine DNA glycosylase